MPCSSDRQAQLAFGQIGGEGVAGPGLVGAADHLAMLIAENRIAAAQYRQWANRMEFAQA